MARRLGGDILVADSRQAYQRLHIATNHPPDEYRAQLRYRGIEFADPVSQVASVFDFLREAGSDAPAVVEGALTASGTRTVPCIANPWIWQ